MDRHSHLLSLWYRKNSSNIATAILVGLSILVPTKPLQADDAVIVPIGDVAPIDGSRAIGVGLGHLAPGGHDLKITLQATRASDTTSGWKFLYSKVEDGNGEHLWKTDPESANTGSGGEVRNDVPDDLHRYQTVGVLANEDHSVRFHGALILGPGPGGGSLPEFDADVAYLDTDVDSEGPEWSDSEDDNEHGFIGAGMAVGATDDIIDLPASFPTTNNTGKLLRIYLQTLSPGTLTFSGMGDTVAVYREQGGIQVRVTSVDVGISGLDESFWLHTNNGFGDPVHVTTTFAPDEGTGVAQDIVTLRLSDSTVNGYVVEPIVIDLLVDDEEEYLAESIPSLEELLEDVDLFNSLLDDDGGLVELASESASVPPKRRVRPKLSANGHHHIPKQFLTGVDEAMGFTDDVIDFAWAYTTDPLPPNTHVPHPQYDKDIKKIFETAKANGTFNPATTTVEQMKGYIDNIAAGNHPISGVPEPRINDFLDREIRPHVANLTPDASLSTDDIIDLGRKRQKTHLFKKVRGALKQVEKAKITGNGQVANKKEILQQWYDKSKRLLNRLPNAKVPGSVKRAGSVLGKGLKVVAAPVGFIIGVVSVADNVEAYGVVEGGARSLPLVGDCVSIVFDSKTMIEATIEINDLQEDNELRESLVWQKRKKLKAFYASLPITKKYADWILNPESPSLKNIPNRDEQLKDAVDELTNNVDSSVYADGAGNPVTHSAILQSAEDTFRSRLTGLGFVSPTAGGPGS